MSWCDRTLFGDGFSLDSCVGRSSGADLAVFVRLGSCSSEGEVQITGRHRIRDIGKALVELADSHHQDTSEDGEGS